MTDVQFEPWNVMQIETRLDDLVFGQEYVMESRVSWTAGGATHTAPVLARALEVVERTEEPAGPRQAVAADVNFRSVHAETGAGLGVLEVGNGAVLWATQDPSSPSPRLDVLGPGAVHVQDGQADGPVSFVIDTNYAAWIDRWELTLYHGDDEALAHPIRLLTGSSWENGTRIEWDGAPNFGERLVPGHELQYVLRVFDEKDRSDETLPRSMFLAPDEIGDERARPETILGENHLRVQNIPVKGGAVRIHGTGLAPNGNVRLEGRRVPVDADGEFVYETILP
jgi:hypothetical protein